MVLDNYSILKTILSVFKGKYVHFTSKLLMRALSVRMRILSEWVLLMGTGAVICGTFCSNRAAGPRTVILQGRLRQRASCALVCRLV